MLLSHGGSSRGISCLLFTRMVLVPNYRIVEFLFTRRVTEVFFVTRHVLGPEFARLVLGPTDQREVIIEFLFSRGMSRMVVEVMRVEL